MSRRITIVAFGADTSRLILRRPHGDLPDQRVLDTLTESDAASAVAPVHTQSSSRQTTSQSER